MDGIVGIYGPGDKDLVNKTFLTTGACQHRGKASTGLAVGHKKGIYIHKGLGRIAEVIDPTIIRIFQDLEPTAALGNIGYTKRKIAEKVNVEPIEIFPKFNSNLHPLLTTQLLKLLENSRENLKNMKTDQGGKTKDEIENQAKEYEKLRQIMSTKEFIEQYNTTLEKS